MTKNVGRGDIIKRGISAKRSREMHSHDRPKIISVYYQCHRIVNGGSVAQALFVGDWRFITQKF